MATTRSLENLEINPPPWLSYPESQTLLTALRDGGGEGRFVGGCVRDALLGTVSPDLDISTTLKPEQTIEVLETAGFKVIPTGLDHGTVTALLQGRVYEVTTLRVDKNTDGRHADVEFTSDWQLDASRRDFTFNALYMDARGHLFDFFGGIQDLSSGEVRFIGNADERIREDFLRILRFYRFWGRFGGSKTDPEIVFAIRKNLKGLVQLSKERVTKEILLLLDTENAADAFLQMQEAGVFFEIFKQEYQSSILSRLNNLNFQFDNINRLNCLFGNFETPSSVFDALRLTSKEENRLKAIGAVPLETDLSPRFCRKEIYSLGMQTFKDQVFASWARSDQDFNYPAYLELAENWNCPDFPVRGRDLLDKGVKAGAGLGDLLSKLEEQWVESDFQLTKEDLLKLV